MALFYSICAFSCDIYQKPGCFVHLGFDLFGIMNTIDCHWLIIGFPFFEMPSEVIRSFSLSEDGKKDTEIIQDEEGKILVTYFI